MTITRLKRFDVILLTVEEIEMIYIINIRIKKLPITYLHRHNVDKNT